MDHDLRVLDRKARLGDVASTVRLENELRRIGALRLLNGLSNRDRSWTVALLLHAARQGSSADELAQAVLERVKREYKQRRSARDRATLIRIAEVVQGDEAAASDLSEWARVRAQLHSCDLPRRRRRASA